MPRRPRPSLGLSLVLAALLALGACRKSRLSQPVPAPPKTMLHVANGEFLDAVVYVVVDGGQRVRLGVANSNRTTTFEIPPHLLFSPTALNFVVDPIGSSVRRSSGDVVIDPGDDIDLHYSGGRVVLSKHAP